MMKKFAARLLGACALGAGLAAAAPAEAQTVNRIVAFGDSYADDGNLFQLLGIPCPQVYSNCRFSDATNFIDTMADELNVTVDNFAIGGAFTGNGNINGPGIPGFVSEWQSFLAGGGPAAFPRVSGTFGPNDLLAISIGGNDARAFQFSQGANPSAAQIAALTAAAPAQAALRVAEATAGLNALIGAGARNITFLAGDVSRLPEVAGRPVAAVGSAYSTAFNNGMKQSLAGIASQGVIVNYLDLNLIGDRVAANLAAFGLVSAGACPAPACVTDTSVARQYLFYVDQVHLTSAGFAIVGRYAVRQLEAPLHFRAQTDAGLQAAAAFGSTLAARLDLSTARGGGGSEGLHFFVSGNAATRDQARTDANLPYELDTFGVSAGAEYDSAGAVFGVAVNHSRPEANMLSGTGDLRGKAWQVGAYGGWSGGGAFVQAHAGYGWLDYDIGRRAVIDDIAAETDGTVLNAGTKAGFLFDAGGFRFGPVAGLHYAKAKIDGYTEAGDPVLTLNVDEQEASALIGSAGVELRGEFDGGGGLSVRPYAALTAEKNFDADEARTVRYALTAAPGIVNSFVIPGDSDDIYGRLAAGAAVSLGGGASLQIQGSTTIGQDGSQEMGGSLALRLGF